MIYVIENSNIDIASVPTWNGGEQGMIQWIIVFAEFVILVLHVLSLLY